MSPAFVPSIKEIVRRTKVPVAQEVARRVLEMKMVGEVRGFLTRKTRQVCPNVAFLDLRQ
jgi:phosphoenolpyruvate-protein phosphotransferase (PTS system enzyme I)